MYPASPELIEAIKASDRIVDAKVEINGVTYGVDNIQSFTFEDTSNPESYLMIGSVAAAKVELSLLDISPTLNLETAEYKLYVGIEVNGTMEYIPLGVFYANPDEVKRKKNVATVVLYDGMIKAQKEYNSQLVYPVSIQVVMHEIATILGVSFVGTLPNYVIPKKPEGYSCRGMIGIIAQLCGGFAKFDRNGNLTIRYYTNANYSIDGDTYIDYEKQRDTLYRIHKVVGRVPKDDTEGEDIVYTAGTGSVEMSFENPFVTQQIVNNIYNRYANFAYIPTFVNMQGNPLIDVGDIVQLTTVDNEIINIPIMNHKLTFSGGLLSEIESVGETESVGGFNISGSIGERLDALEENLWKSVNVIISSSAGNVFKNGEGSTTLTAKTFLNGIEVDLNGSRYEYRWHKFDKNGDYVPGFYHGGKSVTINASTIDEKATYRVEIILNNEVLTIQEITLTNVFDGEEGPQGPQGPQGPKGEDGKTFYTWIKYADTPTSGMSDNPEGKEYIGIAYNKETPTPSTNYSDYTWSKFKGEQGVPGPKGEDGQTTYTWVKYADDDKGNGMSDSPEGKKYIGLAFNKTTPQESNNPNDYTWSLMPQNIEIGGRNLLTNSDFSRTYKGNSFTVDGKTYDTYPYQWGGYNSGIDNPTTNYHAHIDDDTFGFNVVEYNETNGQRNWKGISQSGLEKRLSPTQIGIFTFSVDVYATGTGTRLFGGFYYHRKSDGQRGFHSGRFDIRPTEVDKWVRMSAQCRLNDDVDFSKTISFYIYGYNFATNSILYIKNVKLEYGNKETDWTRAEEDVQEQIDEAKQEAGEAKQEAEEAKQTAQNAMSTADGKNTVFRQSSTPPTTNRKVGDLWFKTDEGNKMFVWTGEWTETKLDHQALSVGKLSAISADLGTVTAGHIQGVTMNLGNGKFVVDSQGNVKFAGSLEGASGSFTGEVISQYSTASNEYKAEIKEGSLILENYDHASRMHKKVQLDGNGIFQSASVDLFQSEPLKIYGRYGIVMQALAGVIELNSDLIIINSFNNPLWTGVVYLTDTQMVTPSKPLSQCMTGWILRWQAYNVGQGAENSNFQYVHIPKISLQAGGRGHRLVLRRGSTMVTKYVYVYDTYMTGLEGNGQGDDRNLVLTGVFEY